MSFQNCLETSKAIQYWLKRFAGAATVNREHVEEMIKRSVKNVRDLCALSRRKNTSVAEKQKYLAEISRVKIIRMKLQHLLKRTGGELSTRENRSDRVIWEDLQSAFATRIRTGLIINKVHLDIREFLKDAQALFDRRIKNALKTNTSMKVNFTLSCDFKLAKHDSELIELKYFNTKNMSIIPSTDLKEWYQVNAVQPIVKQMEELQEKNSGWTLYTINSLSVNVNKYNPMRGSSYIELPNSIKMKKACVNVENNDNKCFMWAVLSALHPIHRHENPKRVSKYTEYENELDFTGIDFPVQLRTIPKFEKQNNISINVYILQMKKKKFNTVPVYITSIKRDRHINLLMIEATYHDEEDEIEADKEEYKNEVVYHYAWIKDLSRLVRSQISKHKCKTFICDRCLHYFRDFERLQAHGDDCAQLNQCKVVLPSKEKKNDKLKFKNLKNKERVPFVIYADFECLLKSVERPEKRLNTEIQQVHEAFSVGYYIKCGYDDTLSCYDSYRGPQPATWFTQELLKWSKKLEMIIEYPLPMKLTPQEEASFKAATKCHICEKPCSDKVRDHCHLTGRYRGAAHNDCNINYKDSRIIPVIFHNLSGYDSHLIIKDIARGFEGSIDLLPLNKERYISFTKHIAGSEIQFRFLDSFRFMAASLDKLASYLSELKIVKSEFNKLNDEQFKLITRKGVFPYEYVDSWEKLDVQNFPSQEDFYSHLNDNTVSDGDYMHAQKVWSEFNIKCLGEYSDLYLKTDVLLLADVFEAFRDSCLKTYGLDPAHYYTTPGLTWDAMLKYTEVELELITDIDMMMFVERGIRGGVSQCSNRYAYANNKYMSSYNDKEESKYLMYYDVNNLYGWAMTQCLPYGGFTWADNATDFNVADDSSVGYILEVDLEYPEILHDTHKDLPFCPEQRKPPGSKESKLLTTLYSKNRYIIHYRNLKQALANGLKLTKVHRVLQFNQSPWLKKYIDLNSEMRKVAKNEFEKNLYKLMNNAVFGKTMENVRKHVNVKLVTKWEGRYGAEALIAKPNFHSRSIFDENLVAIELNKVQVLLNKPLYIGFCVLDLSKTCVYEFHYNYMLPIFRSECKLLYTDTDSLIYEIKCADIYSIIKRDIHRFDTSDYPVNNAYGVPLCNKKIVGLMKDECNGRIMTEFIGLRSKMYSVRIDGEDAMKKAKGVKTVVVKKTIDFNDYVECLRNSVVKYRNQYSIRSQLHKLQTIKQYKIALSPYDDKRYLLADTTDTLPWGYYSINEKCINDSVNCIEDMEMDI